MYIMVYGKKNPTIIKLKIVKYVNDIYYILCNNIYYIIAQKL